MFLSQGKMRITMRTFELIGLFIYLVLIAILVGRQIKVSSDFRNNKHSKLNSELVIRRDN